MRNLFRRIGTVMLVLCLLTTMLPANVLAENPDAVDDLIDVSDKVVCEIKTTYYYDGIPVIITPNCEGITEWEITYSDGIGGTSNNGPSAIGNYTVEMRGKGTNCFANATRSFSIVEGKIDYSVSSYSGTYDGQPHSISLQAFTQDVSVWYALSADGEYSGDKPTFTAPGEYTVYYLLEKDSYKTVRSSATVTIANGTIKYSIGGFDGTDDVFSVTYDGNAHSIRLKVDTTGVSVSYATNAEGPFSATMPSFTEVGGYVVYYKLEKQGYTSVEGSVPVKINPVDVSDQVVFNKKASYAYTGSTVNFAPSCEGIKEWSYTYYQNGALLDVAPSAPGSYTVEISGAGANCYAQVTHAYSIVQETIQYTATGYSGTYDGNPHAITINVTTEGATVSYATSEGGEYTSENPAYTAPGEYTVWYKIEKQYCETITGSATVTITADTAEKIQYTATGYSGTYDGNPHAITINVTTEGATVTYAASEDGEYTGTNPAYIEPGEYTVWYKIEKPYCETITGSATVTIIPKEIKYTVSGYHDLYNYYLNGSITLNILSEGVSATYATSEDGPFTSVSPKFHNSGEYTVWFRLEGTGYRTVVDSATVTILRHDVSHTNATVFPMHIYFSGAPVSFTPKLNIADRVNDVSWTFTYYDENGDALDSAPILPGKYSVDMNGEGTNCFARLHHEFTILSDKRPIVYSVQGYSGDYDGQPHSIALIVTSPYVTVSYATSENGPFTETLPAFTDAGSYTVWYKLEGPYPTVVKSATVQIEPLQIRHGSSGYYGVYDGEAHTIELNVYTEDVTVTYATSEDGEYTAELPYFTDAGEYAVWFKLEKKNYATVIKGRNVSISKVDVSDQVSFNGESIYPYTGKVVKFSTRCEGITAWRHAYFDENNAQLAEAPSAPGSYRVEISGEGANYFANLSHAFSIAPKGTKLDIEFTVSSYSGDYDGQPHSIALNVTTPEVTVTYATAPEGPFTAELPMFTEPGAHIVIYRLERAGYQSIRRTEHVMILPPPPIMHTVSGYSGVYDGEAHTIELNVADEGVAVTYATSEDGPYSAELPTFTDPGEYTVWFRLEKGFSITEGSASVNIAKIDVSDQLKYESIAFICNGRPVEIKAYFDGELPSGDSMELTLSYYSIRRKSDPDASLELVPIPEEPWAPGNYRVTVSGEGAYCFVRTGINFMIFSPDRPLIIEYSASGYSGYFDGKPHSITVDVATPDATVRYATSMNDEYTDEIPSFTQPGAYTVYYKIERTYHMTVTGSAVVEILEHTDKITYAVEGYSGVYDGGAHTIDLQVVTPDVKVTYATSEDGEYSDTLPEYVKPGSYTVWFKLEKSGFETSTGSATVTIEKAEQTLYFNHSSVKMYPAPLGPTYDNSVVLVCSSDHGALSYSFSDPERIKISFVQDTDIIDSATFYASYDEWLNGYVAVITATAAETDCYKAATATYTVMAAPDVRGNITSEGIRDTLPNLSNPAGGPANDPVKLPSLDENINMTLRPVSDQDSNSLLGASNTLWKKLMAAVGEGQIGTMSVDVCLTDSQTGEEIHNTSADVLLSFTGDLQQRYLESYKNMSCIAVHIKQDGTPSPTDTATPEPTATPSPTPTATPEPTSTPEFEQSSDSKSFANRDCPFVNSRLGSVNMSNSTTGNRIGDTDITQVLNGLRYNANSAQNDESVVYVSEGDFRYFMTASGDIVGTFNNSLKTNVAPTRTTGEGLSNSSRTTLVGSFSSNVEIFPCKLTREGVLLSDTTTSPFLLIYGPKEAFSNLLTVRAKDGTFIWDGEGHQVAAEPSIAEDTTVWYSLDLENWQTEAPVFTDVRWNEDGSVGSYQVYVFAENPDCDPAICSYTVTIIPAA